MPFMVLAWPERRDLARGELLVCRVQRQSWWKEQSRIFPEALFFFSLPGLMKEFQEWEWLNGEASE